METQPKRKLSELFQDKRAIAVLVVFLTLMGFLLYRLLVGVTGDDTSTQDESGMNQVNAVIPFAKNDSTTKSKLEIQAEAASMSLPGGDSQQQDGMQGMQPSVPAATDLTNRSVQTVPDIEPYYYNKRQRAPRPNQPTVDSLYEEPERKAGRRVAAIPVEDSDEPVHQQTRELKKKLDERQKLLGLLEEYKRDKDARAKAAKEDEIPKKVPASGVVGSLNGIDRSRNSFYGLYSTDARHQKSEELDAEVGTIRAMIHQDQDIVSGGRLQLRLLEPVQVRGVTIPSGTLLYGICTFGTERVTVNLTGIQYENRIYPVKMTAFDMDGLPGIYVPNVSGLQEARQAYSNSASGIQVGSTYNSNAAAVAGSAAAQAGVSGIRQFLQRKSQIQQAKLKANYYVLLR